MLEVGVPVAGRDRAGSPVGLRGRGHPEGTRRIRGKGSPPGEPGRSGGRDHPRGRGSPQGERVTPGGPGHRGSACPGAEGRGCGGTVTLSGQEGLSPIPAPPAPGHPRARQRLGAIGDLPVPGGPIPGDPLAEHPVSRWVPGAIGQHRMRSIILETGWKCSTCSSARPVEVAGSVASPARGSGTRGWHGWGGRARQPGFIISWCHPTLPFFLRRLRFGTAQALLSHQPRRRSGGMALSPLVSPLHVPHASSRSGCVGRGGLCRSGPRLCPGRVVSSPGAA